MAGLLDTGEAATGLWKVREGGGWPREGQGRGGRLLGARGGRRLLDLDEFKPVEAVGNFIITLFITFFPRSWSLKSPRSSTATGTAEGVSTRF